VFRSPPPESSPGAQPHPTCVALLLLPSLRHDREVFNALGITRR
jgi:hypothetical protein